MQGQPYLLPLLKIYHQINRATIQRLDKIENQFEDSNANQKFLVNILTYNVIILFNGYLWEKYPCTFYTNAKNKLPMNTPPFLQLLI